MKVCDHLKNAGDAEPLSEGCGECLADGGSWLHLRVCVTCGHVGCCDSSKGKHATAHFHSAGHPVVRSKEPGERWSWCYIDEEILRW